MNIAIMQPYLFPYIGYFQLVNAVDLFVLYDDVTYIRKGWINRNYILDKGRKQLITLQLKGASQNKLINEIEVGNNRKKLLKTISGSYAKAPHFKAVFPVVELCLKFDEPNLSLFVSNSLKEISNFLGITTKFIVSSNLIKNNKLKGQDKILHICDLLNADKYINAIGGSALYGTESFKNNHIDLHFMKTSKIVYKQIGNSFVPNLSIIDLLMFCSVDEIHRFLSMYVTEPKG